ncbi:xanthine dehydrogenase protein [Alicycliphilus sp. B1]|nr:xanthine dehydrogenase protein [Alicycliphilus sp. B1]
MDIGQVEGAFIQGMGWLTMEELVWHPTSGLLLTHAPSTYKIPTANDCPPEFNVQLFEGENAEDSIHRSKAVGEPPLLLPFSVFFADPRLPWPPRAAHRSGAAAAGAPRPARPSCAPSRQVQAP